jgi:hypothetical protein
VVTTTSLPWRRSSLELTTRQFRQSGLPLWSWCGLDAWLELITDPDNVRSQRIAEKVGFRREGVLRSHLVHSDGPRRDSVMFSLLPGELSE